MTMFVLQNSPLGQCLGIYTSVERAKRAAAIMQEYQVSRGYVKTLQAIHWEKDIQWYGYAGDKLTLKICEMTVDYTLGDNGK